MQRLDLRQFESSTRTFGEFLSEIQRLLTVKMGQYVPVRIDYQSFPPEGRLTLPDLKFNLNSVMDVSGENPLRSVTAQTILETICREFNAVLWVTPEHIDIVSLDRAQELAATKPRLKSPGVLRSTDQFVGRSRRELFEDALKLPIGPMDLPARAIPTRVLLTHLQRLVSTRMKTDVPLYINYRSFPPEARQTLNDRIIGLFDLYDVTGDRLLPNITLKDVLDQVAVELRDWLSQADASQVRFRATAEYIEIYNHVVEHPDDGPHTINQLILWRWQFELLRTVLGLRPQSLPVEAPRLAKAKPRPEAIRWLTRGIEAVPESAQLHFARAEIYLEMGEFQSAIHDLDRAIELNPGYNDAMRLRNCQ